MDTSKRTVLTISYVAGWVLGLLGGVLFFISFFREYTPDMVFGGILFVVGGICAFGGYVGRELDTLSQRLSK